MSRRGGERFCVVVELDGATRVYGTFKDQDRADDLRDRINARVERAEQSEYDEWDAIPYEQRESDDMAPVPMGRACVRRIWTPSVLDGAKFAMGDPT